MSVPARLILEQASTIQDLIRVGLVSALPLGQKRTPADAIAPLEETIRPPSAILVDNYLRWSGAVAGAYKDSLPPHLFCQWGFGLATRLMGKTGYPLSKGLNQGCAIQVNAPIPRGEEFLARASMESITEEESRVRFHTRIVASTADHPEAQVSDFFAVLVKPVKGRKSGAGERPPEPRWNTVASWDAAANAGMEFAMLTGDFNPIHWLRPVAKLSPFGTVILHGFGTFVRSYEALNAALDADISSIDVRFTKPVKLPASGLQVQTAGPGEDGRTPLRVIGNRDALHMAGSFTTA